MTDTAPEEVTDSGYTRTQLDEIITAALAAERNTRAAERAEQEQVHNDAIRALQAQVTGLQSMLSNNVATGIREHGAGAGTDVAETWSMYEQELAHSAAERARRAA